MNERLDFSRRISAAWRKSVEAIFEAGRLLTEAKEMLAYGDFEDMIERDLPFQPTTARRLMKIAADVRLTHPAHGHVLPASWRTLYELTKLDDDKFIALVASGRIHPEMDRGDIAAAHKRERREEREAELGASQRTLPQKRYGVIYADPPWRFEVYSEDTGRDRTPENHYPTMAPQSIVELPVDSIAAEDCALFMWTTAPTMPQAFDLMKAWGFAYRSQCVWAKDKIGLGFWFRNQHEILMVATKGEVPAPAHGAQWPSLIPAPRGEHSRKPSLFYELIEQYFPSLAKIELFARESRPGWDRWGNQAPIEAAA